ncbi:hypothetical protein U3A55_10625 [Salarchaeum sp. III]|uniref:hypothetical protein n=1 Tax=Salarchaeum sp. III TaxID=3107927 RepID=UPI002EDAFD40
MALLDDAADAAARTPALAVVPFLMTFAAFDKLARASAPGFHVGVKFTFPPGRGTLWSFVSLPGAGVTAHAPVLLAWTPV